MTDFKRSVLMSRVRQKDTGPELVLRKYLHAAGLRYVLHNRSLPGTPDLIFPRFKAVIFVHGCFWHAHGCRRATIPASRQDFWTSKFLRNKFRDVEDINSLQNLGWRVCIVWECALKGKSKVNPDLLVSDIVGWLKQDVRFLQVEGRRSH
ncbi:very short patch repair endonuclease [Rhizobium sp. BK275]|uniref:very short patch repair endonuclease n=1 Tax=Rhizobium sp. BK275 TaxID=2587077 RepID=UPI001618F108|nr:very short patch repair endonuclease [Rhizobium sp. BK275]